MTALYVLATILHVIFEAWCVVLLLAVVLILGAAAAGAVHDWRERRGDVHRARTRIPPARPLDDPCLDPNVHYRETGCQHCGRFLQKVREITDLEAILALPLVDERGQQ